MEIDYKVSPTFMKVHQDTSRVIGVMGPVGSGKSSGMVFQLFFNAMQQRPDKNGVRHSRYAVIRATYPQLRSSTIKTWIEWFKDKIRLVYTTPITGRIKYDLDDGTSIDMEIMFIAIEDEQAAERLRSWEFTGAWVNEAHEVPEYIMTILMQRTNRYPSMRSGGAVHPCILLDYNAVSTDHWLYRWAEETKPEGCSFYKQPPAMIEYAPGQFRLNPDAENIENLDANYYPNIVAVSSRESVLTDILNQYGERKSGKPVYKDYDDQVHYSEDAIVPPMGSHVIIGVDQGLSPAAALTVMDADGTLVVFDEITTVDCSLKEFAEELLWPRIYAKYPWIRNNFSCVIDPAAAQRSMNDAKAGYEILKEAGLPITLARTNNATDRRESVIHFLRLKNKFKLSPNCKILRKGFISGYKYEEKKSVDGRVYKEKPMKNEFSHVHDALQYACLEYAHVKPKKNFNSTRKTYRVASAIGGY